MNYKKCCFLAVSNPQPALLSQGYVHLDENHRVFVRIYYAPHLDKYMVRVKQPNHTGLSIDWRPKNRAYGWDGRFWFEGNEAVKFGQINRPWLCFYFDSMPFLDAARGIETVLGLHVRFIY